MIWARMLAYITGTVDQELLLRNEYLAAENRILRAKIKGRLLLADSEKATLGEIAHRLGRKALTDVAAAAKPDTCCQISPLSSLKIVSPLQPSKSPSICDSIALLPVVGSETLTSSLSEYR
jgi:hypothetical protein